MSMNPGSVERLSMAAQFYLERGYAYREVPWIVGPVADETCIPNDRQPLLVTGDGGRREEGRLPGSGEQGFVQLMLDGRLEPGNYQTTTPCFRDEPVEDELHLPWFTKLELISFGLGRRVDPFEMATMAAAFFSEFLRGVTLLPTGEGVDVVWRGIELGSYGTRESWGLRWTYGTGCAEPRLGIAMARSVVVG